MPSLHHKKPDPNALRRANPTIWGGQAPRPAPARRREQPRLTDDGVDADGELRAQDEGWPSPLPRVGGTPRKNLSGTTPAPHPWPRVLTCTRSLHDPSLEGSGTPRASPDLLVETFQIIFLLQQGQVEVQVVSGGRDLQRAVLQLGKQTARLSPCAHHRHPSILGHARTRAEPTRRPQPGAGRQVPPCPRAGHTGRHPGNPTPARWQVEGETRSPRLGKGRARAVPLPAGVTARG